MSPRRPGITHRTRLVVAFVLLAIATTSLTATVTVLQARHVVLGQTQEREVNALRSSAEQLAPDLRGPLDDTTLRLLVRQLVPPDGGTTAGTFYAASSGGSVVVDATGPRPPVGLVEAAGASSTALVQSARIDDASYLAVAVPVVRGTVVGADARPSGLVVYALTPLAAQEAVIGGIAAGAGVTALPVVVAAILLALVIARNLLRPVRRLQAGVRTLATGGLGAQIPVVDGGEFGALATSFNAMSEQLRADRDELRTLEERARRFSADVSHELRTPLAAMSAVVGVLESDAGGLPSDAAEAALLVAQETRNLTRLVEELIDISRFDAGTAVLGYDEIDVRRLVERTLALRDWDGRVVIGVPDGLRVLVDPRRVDVILANLVGNAIRHAGDGSHVAVLGRLDGGDLVLTVTDDGPGVPTELRGRVFDRFVKGDPSRARSDGSGLGLSIARENARLHGGSLTLEPDDGAGSTFTLRIPASPSPHSPSPK